MVMQLIKSFNKRSGISDQEIGLKVGYIGKWFKGLFLFAFISTLLVACSNDGGEAELRKRVDLYWKYRSNAQTDLMYDMEYPVLKNRMDKNTYIKRYAPVVKYREPVIESVQIDEDGKAADVRIKVIAGVRPQGAKNTFERPFSIDDRWVKADDSMWYHVPKSGLKNK